MINNRAIKIVAILLLFFSTNIAFSQILTVKAVNGDGIYSLLRKGGLTPNSRTIREFIRINANKIGKDNRLFMGKEYIIPFIDKIKNTVSDSLENSPTTDLTDSLVNKPVDLLKEEERTTDIPTDSVVKTSTVVETLESEKKYLHIPIFGEEHEEVEILSNQLKDNYYYLISGHGGPDPGAIGKYQKQQVSEDEYAYDVMLRLARRLLSHGATVYIIIRDEDDGIRGDKILSLDKDEVAYPDLVIPRSQKARLKQRTDVVNELFLKHKGSYQRLIITHVDSRSEGENIDVFFYHDKVSKTGKALALQLQKTFEEKYAEFQPNRTYHGSVETRELYVLKNTYPAAVFIELGNIRNKADQKRFVIKENREALANWICSGLITEYQNVDKSDN